MGCLNRFLWIVDDYVISNMEWFEQHFNQGKFNLKKCKSNELKTKEKAYDVMNWLGCWMAMAVNGQGMVEGMSKKNPSMMGEV